MHMADPRYQGVLTVLNSDEEIYQARVEEALQGRPEQAAEAMVGDPMMQGGQAAQIESVEGMLFSWTGLHAPALFQIGDSIIPVLLFLALWFFLRRCGFSKFQSFVGAALFCLLELYNLNRAVYQRTSFLVTIVTFLLLIDGIERRSIWGIVWGVLGGLLLGFTTGGYFWGWTYAWAWAGILGMIVLWDCFQKGSRLFCLRVASFIGIAIVAAIPAVLGILQLTRHPAFADAQFRSGMHPSHLPESWPYTIIFTILAISMLWLWFRKRPDIKQYRYGIVTVLAGFVALNQQIIHGITFNFASHYLFALIVAAIIMLLIGWSMKFKPRWILFPCAAAALYLAAVGYDGRAVITQWTPLESRFSMQHLSTLLPLLEKIQRGRILSDPETSLFLASTTKHDVVYGLYLKNVLIHHQELADRFCATQMAIPPADRHLEQREYRIWPDANGAFGSSARQKELQLVDDRCAAMDRYLPSALQQFDFQYVLWDEKHHPEWQLDRLKMLLKYVQSGSGWSLWETI